MNKPAYELYREHGIDLETNPVEIGICVQHNNGGLKGNIWWESDLKHLFPVGEVNGSHGVYRPGGLALNPGQEATGACSSRGDTTPA
jgi:succinate dehydrogenase/fumarate reductase flavoprotein subunit